MYIYMQTQEPLIKHSKFTNTTTSRSVYIRTFSFSNNIDQWPQQLGTAFQAYMQLHASVSPANQQTPATWTYEIQNRFKMLQLHVLELPTP